MVERGIRNLKEQCMHRHRFESQVHALRVIGDWISFYNGKRPRQALKMMPPDAAYAATLTKWPEQKPVGHYTVGFEFFASMVNG